MSRALADRFTDEESLEVLAATRRSWHQAAEWLLAGPQHRDQGTIRLQVVGGGFATRDGSARVGGNQLTLPDGRVVPLAGSLADVADSAGIKGGAPENLYEDGSGAAAASVLAIDPLAAEALADWFGDGDAALRRFAPAETPVLWPEHFDVGITVDEVNYGISLGDAHVPEPYAYVGPWNPPTGDFWNQPFGASRTWHEASDVEA